MTSELVSVIIPVFNSEKYLEKCLNSVLEQTYENIEIVVVDDGSTDSSSNILKKYSDRINIVFQENRGLASALQHGINNMKGHWFKWFSPDDIMYPYAIQTLVDEAKNYPSNTILYSNWEIIDENEKILRTFQESNYNELSNFEYNIRLLDGQLINVNTTLIPSHLFEKCNPAVGEATEKPSSENSLLYFFLFSGSSLIYGGKGRMPYSLIKSFT